MSKEELKQALESVEFFDLMQNYRIADISNQENVTKRFEAVKSFILNTRHPETEGDLNEVLSEWNRYKDYLKQKYPQSDEWEFICDFHKRIDDVLSQLPQKREG